MSSDQSTSGVEPTPREGLLEEALSDLARSRETGLLAFVVVVCSGTVTVAGGAMAGVSWALFTTGDLSGLVALLTSNAAWLFTTVFALVGLFVAYPRLEAGVEPSAIPGLVAGRWVLVAVGVTPGLALVGVVGVLAYDPFSAGGYLAFAVLTVLVLTAFVSLGALVRVVAGSGERAIVGLLSTYFLLVFLWDTTIVPLLIALPLVGEPADALGAQPGWFEWLVALSPGRAYAAAAEGVVNGPTALAGFGVVVLLAWVVLPVVTAVSVSERR